MPALNPLIRAGFQPRHVLPAAHDTATGEDQPGKGHSHTQNKPLAWAEEADSTYHIAKA